MNKKLFLIATVLTFNMCRAMNETQITTQPLIYFPGTQVVYIGDCETRTHLETIFNEKFPFNTVFFNVDFKNIELPQTWKEIVLSWVGLQNRYNTLPQFVPYECIKDRREEDSLSLKLFDKEYTFLCRQKASKGYRESTFEDMVTDGYQNFLNNANCLHEGKQSLFDAEVLEKRDSLTQHGKNCTPDAKNN